MARFCLSSATSRTRSSSSRYRQRQSERNRDERDRNSSLDVIADQTYDTLAVATLRSFKVRQRSIFVVEVLQIVATEEVDQFTKPSRQMRTICELLRAIRLLGSRSTRHCQKNSSKVAFSAQEQVRSELERQFRVCDENSNPTRDRSLGRAHYGIAGANGKFGVQNGPDLKNLAGKCLETRILYREILSSNSEIVQTRYHLDSVVLRPSALPHPLIPLKDSPKCVNYCCLGSVMSLYVASASFF